MQFNLFEVGALMKLKLICTTTTSLIAMLFIASCSGNDKPVTEAPNTGNEAFETQVAPVSKQPYALSIFGLVDSKVYYVFSDRLNVRSAPSFEDSNIVGALGLNDEVQVLEGVEGTVFVKISILKTNSVIAKSQFYFVSKNYLSSDKNKAREADFSQKYFMIQNIATEKVRVYKKLCNDGRCQHKMLIEANMAAGEKDKDGTRMTVLGSFNITKWTKFYQDAAGIYPSWYDPNYPEVPPPRSSAFSWASYRVLPEGPGKVRGAFGWYTAFVGPKPFSQWTHGTLGWGADKTEFIDITRGFFANLFSDPRSHGCSRVDNETIAFLRQLLPVGTPVLKVYAVESLEDSNLAQYPDKTASWDYILTKNGVRQDGQRSDRAEVLAQNTPKDQWLEEGTYTMNTIPEAKGFKSGAAGASSGRNGNIYGLEDTDMHGIYYVDSGVLSNYQHPEKLVVGGYGKDVYPPFVIAKDRKLP
jgi:uncharacterized protein YgiM (DUF1202 family)